MRNRTIFYALAIGLSAMCNSTIARPFQNASSTTQAVGDKTGQNRVLGEVTAIDPDHMQIDLKTNEGQNIVLKLDDKTLYRRVPPGETTLAKATAISVGDISVGDRVIARGKRNEEQKTLYASALIVVTRAEITKKLEHDRAEWLKRGISGVVTAVNPSTHEITVLTREREEAKPLVLTAGETVRFRRYAQNSVRFLDAQPSSFAELKVGDQLRALGTNSVDGTRFVPEEVVSATFRTISGQVTAVNVTNNEIQVNDVQGHQPITIVVTGESLLRRLSPGVIDMIKQNVSSSSKSSTKSQNASSGGDIQGKIEQLPSLTLADLKAGDSVLISSTAGSAPGHVTAIIIAAGAQSLLQWQAQQSNKRVFTFGLGLPGGSPID